MGVIKWTTKIIHTSHTQSEATRERHMPQRNVHMAQTAQLVSLNMTAYLAASCNEIHHTNLL